MERNKTVGPGTSQEIEKMKTSKWKRRNLEGKAVVELGEVKVRRRRVREGGIIREVPPTKLLKCPQRHVEHSRQARVLLPIIEAV